VAEVRLLRALSGGRENLGSAVARALEDVHATICGHPPAATRAWSEDEAIIVVFRAREIGDGDKRTAAMPPLDQVARLVSETVLRRTGERLVPLGRSAHAGRGLSVLAFAHAPAVTPRRPRARARLEAPVGAA
jgi:hypothetical protein